MTSTLNKIEMNQNIKYKCLTYGPGIGKTFLDEIKKQWDVMQLRGLRERGGVATEQRERN